MSDPIDDYHATYLSTGHHPGELLPHNRCDLVSVCACKCRHCCLEALRVGTPTMMLHVREAARELQSYVPTDVYGPGPDAMSEIAGEPFMSEAFLYTLIGKEAARSVLSRWRSLVEAITGSRYGPL